MINCCLDLSEPWYVYAVSAKGGWLLTGCQSKEEASDYAENRAPVEIERLGLGDEISIEVLSSEEVLNRIS